MVPSNDPNALHHPGSLSFAGSQASLNLGSFAYDGAGNVKSIGTDLFAYDRVSRLTEANLQGQAASQGYGFDSFGNLTSITTTRPDETGQPAVTPRTLGVSAATNRLTASPYDAAGNVTSLFTLTSLDYDPFNRVTYLAGTGVNKSFLYTADDLRVGVIDQQTGTEDWTLRGLHDKVVRSYRKTPWIPPLPLWQEGGGSLQQR
jgi:hypothetical protein